MFRLVVFDLDGTLVDSRRDLAESANELLAECGAASLPEGAVGRMVGSGAAALVARACAAAALTPPADALQRFLAIYDRRLLQHTRPYPRVDEVLDTLSGRARLALLTNKPLAATNAILAGLNLARHFADDAILGGDGPFPRKPDPAGLRHLLDRVGAAASEAVLVGDSLIDWQTARSASTAIYLARYGFGCDDVPLGEFGPEDRIIDAPADLLDL